jgi:nucleotide-binding universal stress UspA family protein
MNVRPSLLCAVDYSPASAGALHVAAALAEHFVTRLIVLAVREAEPGHADLESPALRAEDERALAAVVAATLGSQQPVEAMCEFELAAGAPAVEITRVARERSCDLIVMARPNRIAGRSGDTATVESVLLATTAPVLLTPPVESGFLHVEDVRRIVRRIVVAVDADAEQHRQRDIAIGLAEALGVDLAFEDVPAPDDVRAAERPSARPRMADTDLMVVSLADRRGLELHPWASIRVACTTPALVLALPSPAFKPPTRRPVVER